MKKILFSMVAAVLLISFLAVPVYAGSGYKNYGKQKSKLESNFFKKVMFIYDHKDMLSLTDKQLDEIKELKIALKKSLIQNKADIEIISIDIKSNVFYSDSIDLKATEKLIDQKYKYKTERAKTLVRAHAKLEKILTEEQNKIMKSVKLGKGLKKSSCPKGMGPMMGKYHMQSGGKCPRMIEPETENQ
jgi:Spy/CpxP family protein refolding chaperone